MNNNHKCNVNNSINEQQGAVLAVCLVLLVVFSLLGIVGMRTSILETRMSENLQDTEMSFQAAEIALKTGENWLNALTASPTVVTSCSSYPCIITYSPTRYLQDQTSAWWNSNSAQVSTTIAGVNANPRYIIEYLRFVPDSGIQIGSGIPTGTFYYRITARGEGSTNNAVTVLFITVAKRY